jgi:cystathionine beta-lyase
MAKEFSTKCVHDGELEDQQYQSAVSPLYMATNYAFEGVSEKRYPRYFNTPNLEAASKKIAALENAAAAMVFSSGMAAISTTLLSFFKKGDHLVLQDEIYGGTRNFVKSEFPKYGIEYTFTSGLEVEDFEAVFQPNTKGVYLETPSNPLLKIVDIKAVAAICHKKGVLSFIDNTFASPVNQTPIDFGIDIVLHSATKYLGGHSDISAGAVVGSEEHIATIHKTAINLGGNLSEFSAWLLERSMKTLALRVAAQNANALALAQWLIKQEGILQVYYPGLAEHPHHERAKKQMRGFGGMLSFVLDTAYPVSKFLKGLRIIKPVMSLAGIESTALSPHLTSHALLTEEERQAQGISTQLVRFSTGIEAVSDLQNDITNALKFAYGSR